MYSKKKTNRNVDTKQITNYIFDDFYQTLICKVILLPPFLILYVSFLFFSSSVFMFDFGKCVIERSNSDLIIVLEDCAIKDLNV